MAAARRAPVWLLAAGRSIAAAAVLPAAYLVVVVAGDFSAALETAFSIARRWKPCCGPRR